MGMRWTVDVWAGVGVEEGVGVGVSGAGTGIDGAGVVTEVFVEHGII